MFYKKIEKFFIYQEKKKKYIKKVLKLWTKILIHVLWEILSLKKK